MHLEPTCVGLSLVAINGIKELGPNVMLLCNTCLQNNERDNFIRCKTLANIDEKLSNIDVTESLKSMERRLTDLVDQKIGNAMKTTCDKVEKTYSACNFRPNITQRRSVEKVPINDWQASVTLNLLVFHRLDLAS